MARGTVTLTHIRGLGDAWDWPGLQKGGPPDNTTGVWWGQMGSCKTSGNWSFSLPTTPGSYKSRLYPNNTCSVWPRGSDSLPFTVTGSMLIRMPSKILTKTFR